MKLSELTWVEVDQYLKSKKTAIIPVGSTEQHGPTGIIGIDYLTAQAIAEEVGKKNQTLVTPPLCFGMALHHMAFSGSMALKPSTYIQVIVELIHSLAHHGFEKITLINGHGGNIAPITSAFSESLILYPKLKLELINWWHLKEVNEYENKVFGEQNGFHATCGEISVTQFTHPHAYQSKRNFTYTQTASKHAWPLSPEIFRETFTDGRMGSNPELASHHHGQIIFDIAVKTIANRLA